jgi:hypothetical protein
MIHTPNQQRRRKNSFMFIVHSDTVVKVPPGTTPDYDRGNPLLKLMNLMERSQLAAERE